MVELVHRVRLGRNVADVAVVVVGPPAPTGRGSSLRAIPRPLVAHAVPARALDDLRRRLAEQVGADLSAVGPAATRLAEVHAGIGRALRQKTARVRRQRRSASVPSSSTRPGWRSLCQSLGAWIRRR